MDEEVQEGFSGCFYVALLIGIVGLLGLMFTAGGAVLGG